MRSSARWLSMALQQYFSPDCPHCFFGALFHAGRDLLRAHLIAHGGDLVEGWEEEGILQVGYEAQTDKLKVVRRKIPRIR